MKPNISAVVIGAAIITSIASLFIEYPMEDPMILAGVNKLGVYASFITSMTMIVTLILITYYVNSLRKYLYEKQRKFVTYIFYTFLLTLISSIVSLVRIIDLLVFHTTGLYFYLLDHKVYWDPVAIGVSIIFVSAAFFFYYLYSYYYTDKSPNNKLTYFLALFYVISFILFIHPANNYSQQIEELTPIKILSRVFLLITIIFPVLFVSYNMYNKLKTSQDVVIRERIKLFLFANFLIVLTIVFFMLDALTKEPYSMFTVLSYVANIIAVISIGLAIISPSWYMNFVLKIRKSTGKE